MRACRTTSAPHPHRPAHPAPAQRHVRLQDRPRQTVDRDHLRPRIVTEPVVPGYYRAWLEAKSSRHEREQPAAGQMVGLRGMPVRRCGAVVPGKEAGARALAAGPGRPICAQCEVRPECLAYAVETGQQEGIWGGLNEKERRELRRQFRRAA